jgi:superfamily II DNA or RNA helicase
MDYKKFLEQKANLTGCFGFEPTFMPSFLFDYQKHLVRWALVKGKAAIFADTGLGKTAMQLVAAQNIVEKTNKNVLILTPLAVSQQTVEEGEKFGIECKRSKDGKPKGKITISNYHQIDKFDSNDYVSLLLDESSILKNFDGQYKNKINRFMSKLPYRSLWTATPSPNDFTELGNSSEALGELRYLEMLQKFFRDTHNDKNPAWSTPKYVLKKHAVNDFWRWVSSWARALRKPSDLGFDDSKHILPELIVKEHVLKCSKPLDGKLFVTMAKTLRDQREERKKTLEERCDKVKQLCEAKELSVIWAHFNYETDYLEKNIDGAVQISGRDKDDSKEEKFNAFKKGEIKRLIIKPKIGAFGLNWQHCNHTVTFPSHSYEQYYQCVRRFYRFGQKRDVTVDLVTTEGELGVYKNIKRKTNEANIMFQKLVEFMNDELKVNRKEYQKTNINIPKFL